MTPTLAIGIAARRDVRLALPGPTLAEAVGRGMERPQVPFATVPESRTSLKPYVPDGPRTATCGALERSAEPGWGGVSPAEGELEGGPKARAEC